MSSTLTYVYCLVRSPRRPSLRRVPAALPGGGDIRLIPVEPKHWLVVSSVREKMYDETALDRGLQQLDWIGPRAVAHEAVVEHFLSSATVLPMQLFTLFKGDDRAVAHIAADRRRLLRILSKIEGNVEWGLRIMWDPPAERDHLRRAPTRPPARSGADYLARKRDQRDLVRVRLGRARVAAERLYRAVAREATAARRRTEVEQAAPGSRLLVDAAFLVPSTRATLFRAAVRRLATTARKSELAVSLTGPWPAYNFI